MFNDNVDDFFLTTTTTTCARIVRLCRSFDRMGDKNSLERSKGHEKTTKTIQGNINLVKNTLRFKNK